MSAADKLAQVLAEHYAMGVSAEGVVECTCGDGFVDFEIDHDPTPEHCAHVAAVVLAHLTAEGWAQGREQWGVMYHGYGNAFYLQPAKDRAEAEAEAIRMYDDGYTPPTPARRRVTDWEPVEGEQRG